MSIAKALPNQTSAPFLKSKKEICQYCQGRLPDGKPVSFQYGNQIVVWRDNLEQELDKVLDENISLRNKMAELSLAKKGEYETVGGYICRGLLIFVKGIFIGPMIADIVVDKDASKYAFRLAHSIYVLNTLIDRYHDVPIAVQIPHDHTYVPRLIGITGGMETIEKGFEGTMNSSMTHAMKARDMSKKLEQLWKNMDPSSNELARIAFCYALFKAASCADGMYSEMEMGTDEFRQNMAVLYDTIISLQVCYAYPHEENFEGILNTRIGRAKVLCNEEERKIIALRPDEFSRLRIENKTQIDLGCQNISKNLDLKTSSETFQSIIEKMPMESATKLCEGIQEKIDKCRSAKKEKLQKSLSSFGKALITIVKDAGVYYFTCGAASAPNGIKIAVEKLSKYKCVNDAVAKIQKDFDLAKEGKSILSDLTDGVLAAMEWQEERNKEKDLNKCLGAAKAKVEFMVTTMVTTINRMKFHRAMEKAASTLKDDFRGWIFIEEDCSVSVKTKEDWGRMYKVWSASYPSSIVIE